jgi:hypothetical protein
MIGAFAVSVFLSNERPIFLVHSNYYQFTLVLTIACTLLVQQIMVTRGESHFLVSRIRFGGWRLAWHFPHLRTQTGCQICKYVLTIFL